MSIESEIYTWLSVAKGMNESLADVIRHDQDHDNWHAEHGDPPCKDEADCARMRASYKEVAKGDVLGHPFHGNQYDSGEGASEHIEGNNLAERAAPTGIQSEQSEMRYPEPTPTPNANKFSHPYQVQYSTPSSLTAAAQTLVNNHLKVDSSGNTPQDLYALALEHEKIAANLRNVATSQSAPPTNSNRQDPDEGEKLQGNSYWRRGNNQRPDGVTANDASSTYSPASASTGDRGRNIISGTTSNRLEDFRLAATSMTKLADPDHGFASTRVRGELGSIREAIQDRITDLKNEALAGGSKFTKGGGNNPTRSAADYKDLISKLTSASSAVGALRSGFRGSTRDDNGNAVANSTHYMASGEYAKDAPKAQAKVDAALQAYDDFYKGTDGNPTGYFDNDKFKKFVSQA